MRGSKLLPTFITLSLLTAGIPGATDSIVLKNGDIIDGVVLDETSDEISVRLKTGVLLRLPREDIQAIETPRPVTPPEEDRNTRKDDIDLRPLFAKPNPTPTPLALVPIQLRLNYTKSRDTTPSSLKLLPPILIDISEPTVERSLPKETKEPEPYGKVLWTETVSKFRHKGKSWQPALAGSEVRVGDEVNSLSGRLVVQSRERPVLWLHPSTQARLLPNGIAIVEGKGWAKRTGEEPFSVHFSGVEAKVIDGLVLAEILYSGSRLAIVEGEVTLYTRPEGEIIRGEIKGPQLLLLDANRKVVSQSEIPMPVSQEWEDWKDLMATLTSSPSIDEETPEQEQPSPEGLLLEQAAELKTLGEAVSGFYLDVGHFPREERPFFGDLADNPGGQNWRGPYLENANLPLLDLWGSELHYRIRTDPVSGEVFAEVFSLGPNRQFEGGDGDDVSITIERPGTSTP